MLLTPYILIVAAIFVLLANSGGLGIFPLDSARNSTHFAATNASRALTTVPFGTKYQVLGILGAKYQVLGAKYQVLGAKYQVPSTWH